MPSRKTVFRWLFAVSLGLNAFLGVQVFVRPPHPHGPPPSPERMAERFTEKMSPDDAAIFRRAFEPHLPRLQQDYVTLRTMPDRMRSILTAQNFDAAALAAAFADLHAIRNGFEDAMTEATMDAAGQMSPEGRAKLWHPGPPGPPR